MATKYLSDYPDLMSEWDWEKNSAEGILPTEVSHSSAKYDPWWICPQGHSYQSKAHRRTRGRGCNVCSGRVVVIGVNDITTTHPELVSELKYPEDGFKYSKGSDVYLPWICQPLGHEWSARVSHRTQGSGCHVCTKQKAHTGTTDLWTVNPTLAGQLSEPMLGYDLTRNSGQSVEFECASGHSRRARVYSRLDDGSDCPNCVSNISKAETELQDLLRDLVPIETNIRTVIPPKELDIYIPSLKIAIEFNGNYFHSDVFKDKNYHSDKTKACAEKGIQLIHVWSDEDPITVHRMLAHKLGVSQQRRVSGNKTTVHQITNKEAFPFLNANHIQGQASGTYYLGLKEKSSQELVAVMVLKRTKDTLSLERYATNAIVMGGQSKILAYVDKNIPHTKMVTFADLSISNGSLYEKSGWVKDKVLPPDYRYLVNGKREHKFNYRLKRFREDPNLKFEEGLSESQLAKLNNLPKVYDCGKVRYVRYSKVK